MLVVRLGVIVIKRRDVVINKKKNQDWIPDFIPCQNVISTRITLATVNKAGELRLLNPGLAGKLQQAERWRHTTADRRKHTVP